MNETGLRWRARIGNSKGIAGFVLLFAAALLLVEFDRLPTALRNRGEPQRVKIEQLVDGTVGGAQHVTVSGFAIYDAGYTETEDGRTVATYYPLLDDDAGYLVVVKASAVDVTGRQPERVTVTGMTRGTPTELRDLIRSDIPDMKQAGLETIPELYLAEGQKPPTVAGTVLPMIALGFIAILCIACFAFPRIVFVPRPVDPMIAPPPDKEQGAGVKATGRFLERTRLEPLIEVGRHTRNFRHAAANLIPLKDGSLLVYIHHIVKTTLYYVATISKQESHWGILIIGHRVIDIEPGKLYGWRDRWAVRFRYKGRNDKPETLLVSFDHAAGQASLVELLQKMGFAVGAGMEAQ